MEEIDVKLTNKDIEGRFNWEAFIEKHKISLIFGLLGLILVGGGFLLILKLGQPEDKIEIISSETSSDTILADIEGAVQKPGVYKLQTGSRLQDLLVAAGGLSLEADRNWAEKMLNRAEKLTDGKKVYIPKKGEAPLRPSGSVGGTGSIGEGKQVNINTASQSELESLRGIGPVTAQKIIDSRPYREVSDLLTKKILKSNVYQRIENQLTVY
ncbi:MAG: helix-hairpin-helix domain-containing protein [Patescibacteria group bacterium]